MIKFVDDALIGIGVRNIVIRLVIFPYLFRQGNRLREAQGTVSTFPDSKTLVADGMIFRFHHLRDTGRGANRTLMAQ